MAKSPFYYADKGSPKSSAVYHSVPTLSTSTLQETYATPQPLNESLLPSRKKPLTLRVIAITVLLTLCTIIPILPWAWYVLIHKNTTIDWRSLVVRSTAGPTQFLLLPTLSMTMSKILVAPLMALYAYAVSADWIRSSAMGDRGRQPSPMHLASLLSLFQGASFFSLATISLGGVKKRQLAWPPILKKVVAPLIWLLFLIYSLTAINVWLNIDAKAIADASESVDLSSSEYSPELTQFSRQINQTSCSNAKFKSLFCGGETPPGVDIYPSQFTTNVLTNGSVVSRAAWLDNNIAILVTSTPPTFSYSARALGVRAACRSITDQCVKCNRTRPDSDTGLACEKGRLMMVPLMACPPYGINVTMEEGRRVVFNPIGPIWQTRVKSTGLYMVFSDNPFPYGDVLQSLAYFNESLSQSDFGHSYYVGNTGFLKSYTSPAVNVMYCDVSVINVVYEFNPPDKYVTTSWELTDLTTASYIGYRMAGQWFNAAGRGFESIDGLGVSGGATYSEIYSRQLSKIAIATASQIVPPSAALQLYGVRTAGTQVTLIGMLLLTLVLLLLIVTTVAIGVHAAIVITRTDSKFLAAARGRLISVYPLVGDSFGGLKADPESHKTAVSAALGESSFLRETEADRLQLVQEPVAGGVADGVTVRLRPRRM